MVSKNEFSKLEQIQIEECIRKFKIDYRTLIRFKNMFMDCDNNQDGLVTIKEFISEIQSSNLLVPRPTLNFFINSMKTSNDLTSATELSLVKLNSIITIFNRCPMQTQGSRNDSLKFKKSIEMPGFQVVNQNFSQD